MARWDVLDFLARVLDHLPEPSQQYEIDPLLCTFCGAAMRIVAFIVERSSLRRLLQHLDVECQQPEPLAHSPPAGVGLLYASA